MGYTHSKNYIGEKFNRLLVVDETSRKGRGYSICLCDCGNITTVRHDSLSTGKIKSCGCLHDEISKSGNNRRQHGMWGTRLHRIWLAMKNRCRNPNFFEYHRYGGRGIKVCDEWQEFLPFYNWAITNGYKDNLTIDRIDNDGNYEPSNCRWATIQEQNANKGKRKCINS